MGYIYTLDNDDDGLRNDSESYEVYVSFMKNNNLYNDIHMNNSATSCVEC
jgi:hypothetical protein